MKKLVSKRESKQDKMVSLYVGEGCSVGSGCGGSGDGCTVGGSCGVGSGC